MPTLYKALKDSLRTEASRLDDVDKRTALLFLEDFENSGVHLETKEVLICNVLHSFV